MNRVSNVWGRPFGFSGFTVRVERTVSPSFPYPRVSSPASSMTCLMRPTWFSAVSLGLPYS